MKCRNILRILYFELHYSPIQITGIGIKFSPLGKVNLPSDSDL